MTPKMTALRNTLGVFAAGLGGGLLMSVLVTNFSVAQIGIGFAILAMIGLGKLVYDLELAKAESLDRLNNLKD